MSTELHEAIETVIKFGKRCREEYADSKEWTALAGHSCVTIRVPVALLNRIRDLEQAVLDNAAAGAV